MESQALTKNQVRYMKEKEERAAYSKTPAARLRKAEMARKRYHTRTPEQKERDRMKLVGVSRKHFHLWARYRKQARDRGYEFRLAREEFKALVHMPCHYCYVEPLPTNGVDRYNNNEGYTTGNSVPCCATCNRAKGCLSIEEFLPWLARVAAAHGN